MVPGLSGGGWTRLSRLGRARGFRYRLIESPDLIHRSQRRTRRYTEQPPALARADAPGFSNVGLSADVHRRAAVGELVVRFSETLRGQMDIDLASLPADRIASVGGGPLIPGTSDHHGSFSLFGFPGCGELHDDGRVWGAWLADHFAAVGHYPLVLGGISGARLRDRKPNHALQATPVSARLEVLSRRPGVPELGR